MSISHTPKYFPNPDYYFNECKTKIPWSFDIKYFHRGYFRYLYGNGCPVLDKIISTLAQDTGRTIVAVFCNYYRDGNDYAGMHQDNYDSDVLTLSLGAPRRFVCHPIGIGSKLNFILESGDLLYFDQAFNVGHKHGIPKSSGAGERISIVAFLE